MGMEKDFRLLSEDHQLSVLEVLVNQWFRSGQKFFRFDEACVAVDGFMRPVEVREVLNQLISTGLLKESNNRGGMSIFHCLG